MKLKIGGKIVLLAFILVLGTAGAVGLISYKGFNRLLVQHELDALGEELELHGIRLGFGIETLRRDVIFLAHTPPIQGIARARRAGGVDPLDGSAEEVWRGRLEAIFTEFLRSRPNYTHARFIGVSSQGREIARVDRLGESIVTVDGPDLQLKGHRLYFRESIRLKEGQVYLSDITLNRERGEVTLPHVPMLRAAMPVYTPEGAVFGIVVVNMDFSSALEKIRTEQHLNYVTNGKGDFLAHPDASKVFGFDLGQLHRIQETYPELEEMFSPDHAARKISVLAGEGDNVFAVHFIKVSFDPLRPERFLGLAQAVSYREVVEPSSAVRNQILVSILLLMAVAAGLVLLFVRPLRQIAQTAEGFAGEMSDSPLPVESQDEIGSLARSFQSMVDKVKAGAKAIKESEARVTAVLNNTVDGIIVIDERGIVETFNPAAEKAFGYAASEVIGQNISMLAAEPHRSQHDEYIQKYLNTGDAKVIGIGREVPGLRKDGSTFPVDLAISEMFIGERRLFIGVTRDITERRKMEKQLEAHAVSLETTVKERTAELSKTNMNLLQEIFERKQIQGQIKASLNEKEVLLREIHHRTKNNMQIIISLLNLQSKDICDKKTAEMFRECSSRIKAMALIHEKIYQSSSLKHIDAHDYISSLANSLFRSFGLNKGAIDLNVNAHGILLDIDIGVPCGLIINELITNALKYAFPDHAKGCLDITLRHKSRETLELIIRDNGPGIPRELDFRNTHTLGLQLVTTLAEEQLEGTIELKTNRGAEFKIVFDRRQE